MTRECQVAEKRSVWPAHELTRLGQLFRELLAAGYDADPGWNHVSPPELNARSGVMSRIMTPYATKLD
jgi:hypothetical protein